MDGGGGGGGICLASCSVQTLKIALLKIFQDIIVDITTVTCTALLYITYTTPPPPINRWTRTHQTDYIYCISLCSHKRQNLKENPDYCHFDSFFAFCMFIMICPSLYWYILYFCSIDTRVERLSLRKLVHQLPRLIFSTTKKRKRKRERERKKRQDIDFCSSKGYIRYVMPFRIYFCVRCRMLLQSVRCCIFYY